MENQDKRLRGNRKQRANSGTNEIHAQEVKNYEKKRENLEKIEEIPEKVGIYSKNNINSAKKAIKVFGKETAKTKTVPKTARTVIASKALNALTEANTDTESENMNLNVK